MAGIPSPIEQVLLSAFDQRGLSLYLKRDDQIHPEVMGNKWRKLKYNLQYAAEIGAEGILTFGGAYSNHIAATAAACHDQGLKSIGIIRGDELNAQSNPTLQLASKKGMELIFMSRSQYRILTQNPQSLQADYPNFLLLPEGGTNHRAIEGCAELVEEIDMKYDFLACSLGTGGTAAGILKGMKGKGNLLIFPAIKGDGIAESFRQLLISENIEYSNYQILAEFHCGGYGKVNEALIHFINTFSSSTGILLDPIYTGKLLFGLNQLASNGYFVNKSRIIMIHSGGLQGIVGYNLKRTINFIH